MVKTVKLKDLVYYEKNAKLHPQSQIDKIKLSIEKFGFRGGVKVTENNVVIVGHGRITALKQLKHEEIEVEVIENLSKDDIRAYRIADNKTAESNWDFSLLQNEFVELNNNKYDVSASGFNKQEIESILQIENEFNEEVQNIENKNAEVDVENILLKNKCPKCEFEF